MTRQVSTVVSGALTWGGSKQENSRKAQGRKEQLGAGKSWQTGGSAGSCSAMKSQTRGKYLLKPTFAPPEGTEGRLLSSFGFYFFGLFGCSVVLFQYCF